jgi:hypothetical protein
LFRISVLLLLTKNLFSPHGGQYLKGKTPKKMTDFPSRMCFALFAISLFLINPSRIKSNHPASRRIFAQTASLKFGQRRAPLRSSPTDKRNILMSIQQNAFDPLPALV